MKIGEAYVDIDLRLEAYRAQLDKARMQTEKATNTMGQKFQALAPTFRKVGMGMTVAGGAITAALGLAVKSSIGFNKEMANIATLIPGSTERVIELKSAIRTMAVDVGKDTGDLAQGAYQVISAFGDTADTVGILGIAAKAATAGVAATTESINLLSAVTKGYGDTSREAVQKASDLAFQTVTLGQTTFPELAASIGKVIPLTAELGVSQEELFAVMATGTGVTGKAAEVSTQLRGIMQSLMSPTADMTTLLEDMGYESGKAMLAEKGLAGTLEIVKKAADASNVPLQKYISSIEGQTLALALTGTQSDTYIEKLAAMRDSIGLTDVAFKEQTEGINKAGFAFNQAKQQIMVLAQEIGDVLLPAILPLVKTIAELVKKISGWMKEHKALTGIIVKAVAVVGGLLLVLGPLLMMLPSLISLLPLLGAAFHLALGPVGLITLAITAVTAGIILLYKAWTENWGGIQEKTRAVVNTITGYFIKFVNFMTQNILNPIISGYEMFYGTILKGIGWLVEKIIGLFAKLPDFILKAFGTSREAVEEFATGVRETMSAEWKKIPEIAEDAFKWQDPIIEKTKEAGAETSKLGKEMERFGQTTEPVLEKAKEGMEGFGGATKRTAEELAKLEERMNKLRAGAESMGLEQEKMQKLIAQTAMTATEKVEDLRKQLGLTKESIADVFASAEAREAAVKAGTETAEAFLYGKSPGGFLSTIKEAIEKHLAPIYRKQEEKMLADWNAFLDGITLSTFETYKELHSFLEELNAKDEATLARMFQDWQSHAGKITSIWQSFTSSAKRSLEDAFISFVKGGSTIEQTWNNLVDVIETKFLTAMAEAILAQADFNKMLESIDWTADSFEDLEEKVVSFMEGYREAFEKLFGSLGKGWDEMRAKVGEFKVKIEESSNPVKQLTENINETVRATEKLAQKSKEVLAYEAAMERVSFGAPAYGYEEMQAAYLAALAAGEPTLGLHHRALTREEWIAVGEPMGVPHAQYGGIAKKAGLVYVEKGERMIPPGKSPVTRNYTFNFTVMPGAKMTKSELRQMVQYEVRPILLELDGRAI